MVFAKLRLDMEGLALGRLEITLMEVPKTKENSESQL